MARSSIANAVAAARPSRAYSANGGTTAPAGAAKSQTSGLSGNKAINPSHPNYVPAKPKPMTAAEENARRAPAPGAAPSGLPWDAQAQQEYGEGEHTYGDTVNEINAGWTGREGWYGFGDNGANNPWSQAALLATHHQWNERGVLNRANNQLYAGATVNAHRQEEGRYTVSYNQLLQAYEAEKAEKDAKLQTALNQWEDTKNAAQLGAIGRAQATDPEPVAGGGKPGIGGDPAHPAAYKAGVGAGKPKPNAPKGYHAYKGPDNQWWFAPN